MDWLNNTSLDYKYWVLQTAAMMLTCFLLPKLKVSGPIPALMTVVTLSFINAHLWSSALFFKIPDQFAYKAILLVLANGCLFYAIVKLLPGIEISGAMPALLAPLIFSVLSILIDIYKDQIDFVAIYKYIVEVFNMAKDYFNENKQTSLRSVISLST